MKIYGSPSSPILDPTVSPDGSMIAYVREEELFVASLRCGEPKQITFGAREAGKVNFNINLRITENLSTTFMHVPFSTHIRGLMLSVL